MMQLESRCTRTDAVRERELYRYFEPPEVETHAIREGIAEDGSSLPGNAKASLPPSTTLTALAQLCALRLDAKRAVVRSVNPIQRSCTHVTEHQYSVIARKTQYFLAEATKYTDITNHGPREVGNEDMWLGHGAIDKTGGLCEVRLLRYSRSMPKQAILSITVLTKPEHFGTSNMPRNLPFLYSP